MAESDEINGTADVLNSKRRNSEALSDNDGHGETETENMQRLRGIQFPAAKDNSDDVSNVQGSSGYNNVWTSPTRENLDGASNSAERSDRVEETTPDREYRQHEERLEYDQSLDSGGERHDLSPSPEEIKSVIITSQDGFSSAQQDIISDLAVDVVQRMDNVVPDIAETIDKVITYENFNQESVKADLGQNVDTEPKGIEVLSTWSGSLIENTPGSHSSNQQGQEKADEFYQVPLQESESMSSKISASPSFLERIRLASFGHERTVQTPVKDNERSEQSIESVNDNNDASSNFAYESVYDPSGDSSFYSSVASPLIQGKAILPNASAELMHLIDSAIQGSDPSNLEKLKHLVAEDKCHEDDTGQSSSQVVVNVLLAKMGAPEGPYDEKDVASPRMMLSVGAALVAGELIPWLPPGDSSQRETNPRTRLVNGLAGLLKSCTRNRSMCCAAGLFQVLLGAAETIFTKKVDGNFTSAKWNAHCLLDLLAVLGSHCLSVQDLKTWLEAISACIPHGRSVDLILPLERALIYEEAKGPSHTFEFDGESSGLLGPGESRWPFVNGYAFATWLYIESFADTVHTAATAAAIAAAAVAKSGKSSAMSAAAAASALAGEGTAHMPRLFSFLSAENQGLEAYFHGQFLVVESASSKGKKASLHFTYNFKPRHWYFIGVEHTYRQSILGKTESEVKLYVDGHLCESRPFEFPRVSKPLAFCCIGTNPPPTMAGLQRRRRLCPLFAEMGPVYIFKEPIGEDRMSRLAARGGDAIPAFGLGAGTPSFSANEFLMMESEDSVALDMELEPSLHLLYHPKLLVGRSCPDASPAGAAGIHRRPAEVLGHVHIAARVHPIEALWAIGGGPLSLLPLTIGGVDKDTMEPTIDDPSISSRAVSLVAPVLRIMSLSLQHPGNAEEMFKRHAPQLLAKLLSHILCVPTSEDEMHNSHGLERRNEEVVASVVMIAQAPKLNDSLKAQFFSKLLLDLKLWNRCSYGLQKKLLSSLADMVFTESATMRSANAVQVLLDCCRKCFWIVPEADSLHLFAPGKLPRPAGEVNALIDELLVIVELLLGTSRGTSAGTDVQILVKFLLDCPQPNQVARVLHLLYRLVVQPNTSRAAVFAENFLSHGGIEMLLTLLQHESEAGETPSYMPYLEMETKDAHDDNNNPVEITTTVSESIPRAESFDLGSRKLGLLAGKNLGGIGLSITADNAKNNFRNIDRGDGIVVAIIGLLGALITGGHLKLSYVSSLWPTSGGIPSGSVSGDSASGTTVDPSVWLLYALQKAFQIAPKRLLTDRVYEAVLAAGIRSEVGSLSTDDHLNLYDSIHCFEHTQILAVLFRVLPYASKSLQIRALQDVLFLACTHSENRTILTEMPEWPEWLLEILISNYECSRNSSSKIRKGCNEIEDLVYNFLMIILEHSLRQKDGWKDVEATIHCAEWLAMIGGSSSGEQRQRREESLPIIKRRLLSGLLEFAAIELQLQTQVVAAAAAGVAAEGLSPRAAKAEADAAAYLSMALAENAIVLLMLVEDHLRLQCQIYNPALMSAPGSGPVSPRAFMPSPSLLGLSRTSSDGADSIGSRRFSSSNDSGGLSLDVLASMADSNGQISAAAMERLTAAAAAEPYESVRCAFVSYGSCGVDIAAGWKRRSRMWYGVGLPTRGMLFGGGGSGWDSWMSVIEKDENGDWIELPLVGKSILMLQALLLDASVSAAGNSSFGYGGGAGTGASGMHVIQQLLDSDQPFFTMLRMVLLSMREEDKGVGSSSPSLSRSKSTVDNASAKLTRVDSFSTVSGHIATMQHKRTKASLLWCVLAPLLTMPLTESRRQRVLVAACILYAEVWHAVSADKKFLRKHYVEMIVPPFVTLLRRWRPLLSGMHELTDADGQNPLAVEDRALAIDAHSLEAAAAMVTPEWAAAFASPPAAMALAMAAAGAGGGDFNAPKGTHHKREHSALERKTSRLRSFVAFQKVPESPTVATPPPKDKAGAKAAAMAAAREQERAAKIGSGRGLGAVAMASSAQRRTSSDKDRARRWGVFEAMNTAWLESCMLSAAPGHDLREREGNVASLKLFLSLSEMFESARNLRQSEVHRSMLLCAAGENDKLVAARAWRQLLRHLLEIEMLFGPIASGFLNSQKIFWKLDPMENSLRMRKRLKRNYKGTDHHGAAADYVEGQINMETTSEAVTITSAIPPSEAAKLVPEQAAFEEGIEDEGIQSEAGDIEDRKEDRLSISSKQSFSDDHVSGLNTIASPNSASVSTGMTQVGVIETREKLLLEIPAMMVQLLRVSTGYFRVTTRRIYFTVDNDAVDQFENISSEDISAQERWGKFWPLSALREVYSRRYLLRRSALELFMVDRSNIFFNFGTTDGRRKAYKAIIQARPPFLNNLYAGTQRPEQLLRRTQLTERWARWEISNFEYLMQLNTLAGRTYNDITQYPVFPWVLSDYTSESLDLNDPGVYRDLSKPVGALNPSRLEKFMERYDSFDDPVIPRFHYGSHYSSAGTVLYYLARLEPFTTLAIQLQGGKFDHADRMFGDVGSTWKGVLEDMSDVKELVPEMFYLPEVLVNVNNIYLGRTQKGEQLGDVNLPPWAKSPVDFIQKHRLALESPHVSAHLHEWIDLIFGYKQRGKEAIAAKNVFFYMTYEGAVDIDKITDPVIRKGTQDQISYFGQTPSQLLTSPHIKRLPVEDVLHLQTIFRNPSAVQCYAVPFPERCNVPSGAICATRDFVVTADMKAPSCAVAVHKWQPHTPDGHGLPFLFQHGKPATSSAGGALSRMFSRQPALNSGEWRYPRAIAFAAPGAKSSQVIAITPDACLLTGGHADSSLKLVVGENARTVETASGHSAPITCVALSPDGAMCVTGSRDSTAILWRIDSSSFSSMLETSSSTNSGSEHLDSGFPEIRRTRIEGPLHVLRGHVGEITSCCVNADIDIAVSCSETAGVILHSVSSGRCLRHLQFKAVDFMSLSSEGIIILWDRSTRNLSTVTINGVLLSTLCIDAHEGDVSSIAVSMDGRYAVLGTSCAKYQPPDTSWYAQSSGTSDNSPQKAVDGQSDAVDPSSNGGESTIISKGEAAWDLHPRPSLFLLDVYNLEVLHKIKLQAGQDVTAIALNNDSTNMVVSTVDGQLFVYTDPALSVKVVDQMLRLGWQGAGLAVQIS